MSSELSSAVEAPELEHRAGWVDKPNGTKIVPVVLGDDVNNQDLMSL
jgi:hypothetical protein